MFNGIQIKLNGVNRDGEKEEIYYTHVTPWSRGSGYLNEGEYMYSFALFPMELQPSGAINMSQIEDSVLVFRPSKELIKKFIENNVFVAINIWGCTYNILRVMSGMAAPLFYQTY